MKRLPALLSALVLTSWGLAQPANPAATGYGDRIYPALGDAALDVQHYDLRLRLEAAGAGQAGLSDTLSGQATLSIVARAPLQQLSLDFLGPKVSRVQVDGQPVRFQQGAEKLTVTLPGTRPAGRAFTVTVTYQGTPGLRIDQSDGGLRLGWITQGAGSYVLSEPDGARTFFPCNDVPADGASYTVQLDVPAGYTALASGTPQGSRTAQGRTVTTFELPQPIPTYALGIHVNRLDVVTRPGPDGIVLRDAYPVGLPQNLRTPFASSGEMIGVLQGWLGRFPFATYGVALTEDPGIPALETATLSTFPARQSSERVAVHELAHQWFGDTVRLADWSDVWLNEGFATYAELLWTEQQGGNVPALVQSWYSSVQRAAPRPLVATRPEQLFDASSYLRGALTLQALRLAVGDDPFRRVLQTWVQRYGGQSAGTADFLRLVQQVAGEPGAAAIRPWVEQAALPPLPVAPD
ncbi:M1 family metallopeptidase [Deinococcus sonorensis]|uniref:Aminopeptidase N n=2 Tax=Deinococcus sonorensis TaxID=309891 RepID=A0AAU7UEN9_9DEIO